MLYLQQMINNKKQASKEPVATHMLGDENNLDEDSIFEEEDNNFALRNENYELKSLIHKLQYQKNKLTISYETTIKELKHKYNALEKIMSENNDKYEKQIVYYKGRCQQLSEENQQLKRDIHVTAEQYRVTPNFKQLNSNSDGFTSLIAQLEKPQNLAYFEKMMDTGTHKKVEELKEKVTLLQKQNYELKQQAARTQRQKDQTIQVISRQTEQHHNSILRFKDKTIEELKNSQIQTSLQLQQAKKTIAQMNSNQSDSKAQQKHIKQLIAQGKEKDSKISQLEQNIYKIQLQYNRTKLEKTKLENELKLFENERKEGETKKKFLQEQLFRLQSQLNQVKNSAYNEKLQQKKYMNSMKSQFQDQKMKLKYLVEEKNQQNKRLKQAMFQLDEANEQLKYKVQSLTKDNILLKESNEKLLRQMQESQKKLNSAEKFRFLFQQKDLAIDKLKKDLAQAYEEIRKLSTKVQESYQRNGKNQRQSNPNIEEQLNHKQELIQLLKMDKDEISDKVRQLQDQLKQKQALFAQKNQKIASLQQKIRYLQDDNKQLLLANDEQRQKIDKLKRIKEDIQNINSQLKKEKTALAEKRRQQSRIRYENQKQKGRLKNDNDYKTKAVFPEKFNKQEDDQFITQQILRRSKESNEGKEILMNLVKQLKVQNYELQNRLNEAENERDRKGVDLDIKQSQLNVLKSDTFKPRQLIFQPLIQVSKKNQFNAVFFQNQVMELQKEINSIRTMKQKELEQAKKLLKKQMDEKYQKMLMREKAYNGQLQKKCNYLTQKLNEQKKMLQEERQNYEQLQKENYSLKLELSQNLQQLNKTLQSCKLYQEKLKQSERYEKKALSSLEQFSNLKSSYDGLAKRFQEQSLLLNNANQQIRRLNDILMIKQSQLRGANKSKIHQLSPNNSFLKSNQNEDKQRSIQGIQGLLDLQRSGEGESIRTWSQRRSGPVFSRI